MGKVCTQVSLARRYQRAIEGLAKKQYTVTMTAPAIFEVRKRDGNIYKVRLGVGWPACTCKDWSKHGHGHICKHILMVGMTTTPSAYVGFRTEKGTVVYVVRDGNPKPLYHAIRHSPTGFEWGYNGSGPADLAFSILFDYLQDEEAAEALKQSFKSEIVSRLPFAAWMLTEQSVSAFLHRHSAIPVSIPTYA